MSHVGSSFGSRLKHHRSFPREGGYQSFVGSLRLRSGELARAVQPDSCSVLFAAASLAALAALEEGEFLRLWGKIAIVCTCSSAGFQVSVRHDLLDQVREFMNCTTVTKLDGSPKFGVQSLHTNGPQENDCVTANENPMTTRKGEGFRSLLTEGKAADCSPDGSDGLVLNEDPPPWFAHQAPFTCARRNQARERHMTVNNAI